jgi:type 1 glutamine amidotransferase
MKLRTLVLCEDAWHPADVVRHGLNTLADSRFDFKFVADGKQWSPMTLKDFPIVIVAKANHIGAGDQTPWLTTETQGSFREFAQRGGGLFFVHAGTCYKDLPAMRAVTGGAFLNHPEQCAVTVEPKPGHPLAAGANSFTETDEHYLMSLDAVDADTFLHTRSLHGVQPAGWTRSEGSGRVCVLTPGHNLGVWLNAEFQKLLGNGLNWLAKLN